MLVAPARQVQRTLCPPGIHPAQCIGVVDIGTHPRKGRFAGLKRQVMIGWELPETRHEFKEGEGPQPFHRWRKYTLSLHDSSNLRKDIESWRGRSFRPEDLINFDLFVLLGRYCHLQIQHEPSRTTGQMYDRIERILPSEAGTVRTPPSVSSTDWRSHRRGTARRTLTICRIG